MKCKQKTLCLCITGIFIILCSHLLTSDWEVVGWGLYTTRNTSQYILINNFSNNLMPRRICDKPSLVLFMVCSSPENFEARKAIRETWGSEKYVFGNDILVYFLIGESINISVQDKLSLESDKYGDIIQERFLDSYYNLTLKSIYMLKIFNTHCLKATKYLLKIDDDMFVNVPRLIKLILDRNDSNNVLLGKMFCHVRPLRNPFSKWYSPMYMYKDEKFPNFISGTGYLMSADVAHRLFEVTFSTPIFHLEDVYITGMCAEKAKIKPQHDDEFTCHAMYDEPCIFKNLITIHYFDPLRLRETFAALKDPNINKICERYRPMFSARTWIMEMLTPKSSPEKEECL